MNPQDAGHKYFLKTFFIAAALALLAIGGFNLIVDPLGVYGIVNKKGFNEKKVMREKLMDLTKAIVIRKERPEVLIYGTSRTEIGIRATHPGFQKNGARRVYNAALPGQRMEETLNSIRFSIAAGDVKELFIGLDFFQFNANTPHRPSYDPERLRLTPGGKPSTVAAVKDRISSLFSLDLLAASFNNLKHRKRNDLKIMLPDGRMSWDDPIITREGGHHVLFFVPYEFSNFSYVSKETGFDSIAILREIIKTARKARVKTTFFISPVHAVLLEITKQGNTYAMSEEWKRMLVKVIDDDNAAHPGESPFLLYDFEGYSELNTEVIPPKGDRTTRMKYYYEASHYRPELGDYVLDKVLGYTAPERKPVRDFGTRIDSGNIETHLKKLRTDGEKYAKEHPEYMREIKSMNGVDNKNRP